MEARPSTIGPYEVLGDLGRGGMGVVYLARDPKLDRRVAIKALPDDVAADEERRSRFDREARALAALHHANIGSIFGLEQVDGHAYLILEFVDGPTLEQLLESGPLPVGEALSVARQIAEAVEAAHDRGIVHRDLKPANIKITPDDHVKVLDFGLAKAVDEQPTTMSDSVDSPTYVPTHTPTMPGVVLGSAGYLSPEQARGKGVDKRCDIFSFGCLLYEMLTGAMAFPGETVTDSLGATLHREPEWDALPAETPPTVQLLLRRCLVKDRRRRLHDIADARIELEEAIADPSSTSLNLATAAVAAAAEPPPSSRRVPAVAMFVLGAALAGAAALAVSAMMKPAPAPRPVHRLSIVAPLLTPDTPFSRVYASPDGESVVIVGRSEGAETQQLFLRRLTDAEARPITGTERETRVCFSPDGRHLAILRVDAIVRMAVDGGPATTVARARLPIGVSWCEDGFIYFSQFQGPSLHRVPEHGGETEILHTLDSEQEQAWVGPLHALPDGSGVLYTAYRGEGATPTASIEVYSSRDGTARTLVENGVQPVYLASGHLVFVQDNTIMAVPFDTASLELRGPTVPVVQGVRQSRLMRTADWAVSSSGTLFHLAAGFDDLLELQVVTPGEPATPLTSWTGLFESVGVSHDGTQLAVQVQGQEEFDSEIWTLDIDRDIPRRLTRDEGFVFGPQWSPDGAWVYYTAFHGARFSINRRRADGSAPPERLWTRDTVMAVTAVFADGERLLLAEAGPAGQPEFDLSVRHIDDDLSDPLCRVIPPVALSPDESWIAYASLEAGTGAQVFVRSVGEEMVRRQVSRAGGRRPQWSSDGRTLYFDVPPEGGSGELELMRVSMHADDAGTLQFDEPVPFLTLPGNRQEIELMPGDEERFVVIAPPADPTPGVEIAVIQHFDEMLKRVGASDG